MTDEERKDRAAIVEVLIAESNEIHAACLKAYRVDDRICRKALQVVRALEELSSALLP